MKTIRSWLVAGLVCASTTSAYAQFGGGGVPPAKVAEDVPSPKPAESKILAVTVFRGNALVTREVVVPEGKGVIELVVTPLPSRTLDGSLYTESTDGFRVLSSRLRTRAVRADTRKEVRAREEQVDALRAESARIKGEIRVAEQNLEFLQKLEGFTGTTLHSLAEKGGIDSEKIIVLSDYVMNSRAEKNAARVELERKAVANIEATDFLKRQMNELSVGSNRTETDGVILVEKLDAPAGSLKLNYLVDQASWTPRYRLRANTPKDPVRLEYLAAIEQQTGEDWTSADLTLSTAQPSFNATPPDLLPLDVSTSGEEPSANKSGFQSLAATPPQGEQVKTQNGGMGGSAPIHFSPNGNDLNQIAAMDQARELLSKDDLELGATGSIEGPSVTYRLKGRRTVPSRRDAQVVEVTRFDMTAEFFSKAVPVLSSRVYKLAKLTNTGDTVLLPGEASMYVGGDFVGRMTMPQVALGEPFVVGFGVDPQLQIGRRMIKKERSVQGGNQVLSYEFRIVARNFGDTPAKLQIWDRLPKPEGNSVAVSLVETNPELSKDSLYTKTGKTDKLLRWDLEVPAHTIGDKALAIVYAFKLEYAKDLEIDSVRSGALKERPIGGMGGGGMGGGMGGAGFRSVDAKK